jgi:zinc protease
MRLTRPAHSIVFGVLLGVNALMLALAPDRQALAQPKPPLAVVTELEGISEYRLPNGVQVLLFPDEGSTTVTVNVVYRVGSVHEGQGESGMAHLLEHMLFKGTPTHPDIPALLGRRGVRWNATTAHERTNYFSSFNASDETLETVLRLEADRMQNSRVAREDLTREMPVVRNEFERADSKPQAVLFQSLASAAYRWHPYGRAVIGARSDIEQVSIERLQAFYHRHYRPDQATVMVAGRIDAERTLAAIQSHFGPLANPAAPPPGPVLTVEPPQDGERQVVVRRVGDQPVVMASWHTPAITHPDAPALVILGSLLSHQPGGLLYKRLVESRRAVLAGAFGQARALNGQFIALAAVGPTGDLAAAEATLLETIEGSERPAFTEAELARARHTWAASYEQLLKKPESVVLLLSESVSVGDWRSTFALLQRVQAVTLADVDRVARAYLKSSNRTLARYIPTAQPDWVVVPAAPPVAQMLEGLALQSRIAAPERFDATPALLESRTTRSTLPSGIRLGVLRKQNRGDAVTLKMEVNWARRDAVLAQRLGFAETGALIMDGSTTRDRQALADELLRLKTRVQIEGHPQGFRLTLSSERDQLLPALAVVADALKNPALPEAGLERIKAARVSALQASRERPGTRLDEAWREHLNRAFGLAPEDWWDPRYKASLDDNISRILKVGIDDVRAIHRDFWSASNARIGVVGGIPDGLAEAVETHFGAWKKPVPAFERFTAAPRPVPAQRFDVELKNQSNAELVMFSHFALKQLGPDFMPLLLATHVLGGGALDNRLAERIRQREGLSYGVGAQLYSGYFDDRAELRIQGSFAPENRDRMLAAVREELARALHEGFTEAELLRARTSLLEQRRRTRAQDEVLASELLWHFEVDKTFAEMSDNDARMQAVTLPQLADTLRRYIDPQAFVIGVAGSFEGKVQNPPKAAP